MTHTKPLTKRIQPVPVEKAKDEQRPDLLIPKAQFQQEVQVIAKNLKTEIIFHESAVEALQEVAEAHLMGLIEDASVCATYDNRVTIMPKDIQLARSCKSLTTSL